MELTLKITSIIFIVFGALAVIGAGSMYGQEAFNSALGGIMFIGQGILTLVYIKGQADARASK